MHKREGANLRIVGSVHVLSGAILARSCVIATDDEMRRAKILPNDGVPNGFARTAHPHRKLQQRQSSHAVRIRLDDSIVHADSRESIDVARLREADDRVNQNIRIALTRSTNGELSVSAMHRVSRLESYDSSPLELIEEGSQFSRRV